ncbi:tripartite tricarboxylate transporter TctB family protein [Virgibacillus natechei]|uniref:tripartite tricarboxylate transporter TctB family protein n=1 Tax=Virgibacillus sp. CBA3643 TaxID=2942278 RepID=UPI0035A296F0
MVKQMWLNVVLIVFSVFMLVQAFQLPSGFSGGELGPEFFPVVILCILILLNIIDMITKYVNRITENKEQKELPKIIFKNYFLLVFLMVLYVASLGWIDYRISTFIFVFSIMLIIDLKDYKRALIVSVGFVLFLFLVFDLLLRVPMP